MNISTNVNPDIQLVDNINTNTLSTNIQDEANQYFKDNTQPVASSSNIKSVLTSASLENLNEQAERSWSEGSSSPDSDKTVTQASISESNASSSSSSSSLLNASNLIRNTWRSRLSKDVNSKINFIESSLIDDNLESKDSLADYFAFIINEYNLEIDLYNYMKSRENIDDLNKMKESIYYFREWISENQSKIFPTSNVTI